MSRQAEIKTRRALLFSARMRISPASQEIREKVVDRFVEYSLLSVSNEGGLTPRELERSFTLEFSGSVPAITQIGLKESLERLVSGGRVISEGEKHQKKFQLAPDVEKELQADHARSDVALGRIIESLFSDQQHGIDNYKDPFLDCICRVFSKLGGSYAKLLTGKAADQQFVNSPDLMRIITKVARQHNNIDHQILENGILRFFEELNPEYDLLKWNMAQNYYIAHIIGIDSHASLLSHSSFENAVFYFDTNILIHALEPLARFHGSFRAVRDACNSLKSEMLFCQISLDELLRVIGGVKENLADTVDKVPAVLLSKVRNIFVRLYCAELDRAGEADIDSILAAFNDPASILEAECGMKRIDDKWFDEVRNEQFIQEQIEIIKDTYNTRRNRVKSNLAAQHDAMLVEWVRKERRDSHAHAWIVTLDTSLPALPPSNQGGKPIAITLDALLQWIAPISLRDKDEDGLADIFSEAVKYQLLPSERIFDIADFRVFSAIQWSCKDLPPRDVEDCVRELRTSASKYNLADPAHREKIARRIDKFFSDPEREYKTQVGKLEGKLQESEEGRKAGDAQIKKLHEIIKGYHEDKETRQLRASAYRRLLVAGTTILVLTAIGVFMAIRYGNGDAWVNRLGDLLYIPSILFFLGLGLSWPIIGKDRFQQLSWSIQKIFR